jgi:hypothetical protein
LVGTDLIKIGYEDKMVSLARTSSSGRGIIATVTLRNYTDFVASAEAAAVAVGII